MPGRWQVITDLLQYGLPDDYGFQTYVGRVQALDTDAVNRSSGQAADRFAAVQFGWWSVTAVL